MDHELQTVCIIIKLIGNKTKGNSVGVQKTIQIRNKEGISSTEKTTSIQLSIIREHFG